MTTVDAALGAALLEWAPERLAKDGTPIVEGSRPSHALSRPVFVTLAGPADDLWQIAVADQPASSIDDAGIALAVLRTAVPAAEDWFRGSFTKPPTQTLPIETFDGVSVGWTRDAILFDGRLSYFAVSVLPLGPTATPTPTAVAPSPTSVNAPIVLIPAFVAGVPMIRFKTEVSGLPDADDACLPICARQVTAVQGSAGRIPAASLTALGARGS